MVNVTIVFSDSGEVSVSDNELCFGVGVLVLLQGAVPVGLLAGQGGLVPL
jgi:hypothetical protein